MLRARSAGSSTGEPGQLEEQLRDAGLRVVTLTEEAVDDEQGHPGQAGLSPVSTSSEWRDR
jgi:hypothetical protein